MTPAPSIDAVSGLVEELRAACVGHPAAAIAWPHRILHRAASALEAQARELAEARGRITYWQDIAEAAGGKIAAFEDAVRVKDEALREAIEFADQDAQALMPAGISMVDRWRAAVSPAEKLCPHAPTYDAGLCCGHPDDCTFVSPPRTALSNGEPHDR